MSVAERLEKELETARNRTRSDFLSFHEKSNVLVVCINELVASHLDFIKGKDWRQVDNGEYIHKLIVSFTRSHFLLYDLILTGELIDAGLLFRKQVELFTRLCELESGADQVALLKKTPNIKHIDIALRRLYSDYSEVAHSSTLDKLGLIGTIQVDESLYTQHLPSFDENAYVNLLHLFMLVAEYHYWIVDSYSEWFSEYDSTQDCKLFARCVTAYESIYIQDIKFSKIGVRA
ncbi:hypothetical protein [Microbulbifer sp. TRSA005]|uniref:hypothetical protein n=1 Tax=Microbulbifer sp. TRSA005 TaxID=3243383 RepID=UPI00403A3204